jgi:hypothetical protein
MNYSNLWSPPDKGGTLEIPLEYLQIIEAVAGRIGKRWGITYPKQDSLAKAIAENGGLSGSGLWEDKRGQYQYTFYSLDFEDLRTIGIIAYLKAVEGGNR